MKTNRRYRLSIIIPVYNIQGYIGACLDSIIPQLSEDTEIILVDDGSSDDSLSICNGYRRNFKNITVIHQINQGVSAARNNGLRHARGDYVYFVDGDDLLAPYAIQRILEKILTSNVDIISGEYIKFRILKKLKSGTTIDTSLVDKVESQNGGAAIVTMLKHRIFMPNVSTNIFKRELFGDSIRFDEGVNTTEDLSCGLELYLKCKRIGLLCEPIYYYRQSRKGSATNYASKERVEDLLDFIKSWTNRISGFTNDGDLAMWLKDYMLYQYLIALGLIARCPFDQRSELIERATTNELLFESRLSFNTLFVRRVYLVFGLRSTSTILGWFLSLKSIMRP